MSLLLLLLLLVLLWLDDGIAMGASNDSCVREKLPVVSLYQNERIQWMIMMMILRSMSLLSQ